MVSKLHRRIFVILKGTIEDVKEEPQSENIAYQRHNMTELLASVTSHVRGRCC